MCEAETIRVDFERTSGFIAQAYAHIYRRDRHPDETVVVVLAPIDAGLRPLAEDIHRVATAVERTEMIDRDRVVWIEYQPENPGLVDESWEIVTFSWRMEDSGDETALSAYWLPITRDAADVLCGGGVEVVG